MQFQNTSSPETWIFSDMQSGFVGPPGDPYNALIGILNAAGFSPGDRFELAAKTLSGLRTWLGTDPREAAAWLAQHAGVDCYYGTNPICPYAQPPNNRTRNKDVASVRLLLLDADPADDTSPEARQAAIGLANEMARLIPLHLGITPPIVDSGRGAQVLLRHESRRGGDAQLSALRKRLLRALAKRLDQPLAHVDIAVANSSRLARLPWGTNTRTGFTPQLIYRGDGLVASLACLEAFVLWLEAGEQPSASQTSVAVPSPDKVPPATSGGTAPVDPRLQALASLLACLPPGRGTSLWLGAQAHRAGAADRTRSVVSETELGNYDQGVGIGAAGGKLPRPVQNEALLRKVTRAIEALAVPTGTPGSGGRDIRLGRIVHRLRAGSRGGEFDVEVAVGDSPGAVVRGLSGRELRSYVAFGARAAEVGVLLPHLPKEVAQAVWLACLAPAFAASEKVELPDAMEDESVIEDEIRSVVREAPRGESVEDLDRGHVLELGGEALVKTNALIRAVKRAMGDEQPKRAAILRVAVELGGQLDRCRRMPPNGEKKRSVLVFPVEAGAKE